MLVALLVLDWKFNDSQCICIAAGDVQITRVSLPDDFLISLHQVDCNGTEMTLAQCPGGDATVCLRPGAGVTCPAEITTTNSIISASTPQVAQSPTTESTLLTTQAETITDRMTSTKSTTPLITTSSVTTPRETTTETEVAMTTMPAHNATMAQGMGDLQLSGAQQIETAHFLPAVLLIIIYNF